MSAIDGLTPLNQANTPHKLSEDTWGDGTASDLFEYNSGGDRHYIDCRRWYVTGNQILPFLWIDDRNLGVPFPESDWVVKGGRGPHLSWPIPFIDEPTGMFFTPSSSSPPRIVHDGGSSPALYSASGVAKIEFTDWLGILPGSALKGGDAWAYRYGPRFGFIPPLELVGPSDRIWQHIIAGGITGSI